MSLMAGGQFDKLLADESRKIVYTVGMSKRLTGVGRNTKKSPHKTKKRLEKKYAMLAERASHKQKRPRK